MFRQCSWVSGLILVLGGLLPVRADDASALRLIPFPKESACSRVVLISVAQGSWLLRRSVPSRFM